MNYGAFYPMDKVVRMIVEAVQEERRACAEVADRNATSSEGEHIASEIRKRGEMPPVGHTGDLERS